MSQDIEKDNDLIAKGDEAEALMASDAFNNIVNTLVEETFQQFVNTGAEDASKREQIYNKYRALVDIVHTLQQRVAVRDQMMSESDNNGEEQAP